MSSMQGINPPFEDILFNIDVWKMTGEKKLTFAAFYPYPHLNELREAGFEPMLVYNRQRKSREPKAGLLVSYSISLENYQLPPELKKEC